MIKYLFLVLSLFCSLSMVNAADGMKKTKYPLCNEPIDVVIPATSKDSESLSLCIEGIRNNCSQIGRIIVISSKPLTDQAEWVDEVSFPFTREDVALYLNKQDLGFEQSFQEKSPLELEEYYQKLVKLYAAFIIPELSSNVLIVDSGTIFLNPVEFLNAQNGGLYTPGLGKHNLSIYNHAKLLIPGFKKAFFTYSGQAGHMIFQRPILKDLFAAVETEHKMAFWKAYCLLVDVPDLGNAGAEYELYFNFAFSKTNQLKIRRLKGLDVLSLSTIPPLKAVGYHYISCPTSSREWLYSRIQQVINQSKSKEEGHQGSILILITPNAFINNAPVEKNAKEESSFPHRLWFSKVMMLDVSKKQ